MTVDAVTGSWWQDPAGFPPSFSSKQTTRSVLAAGFLVAFVLASTGIAAAISQANQDDAMRRFCASYRSLSTVDLVRDFRPTDIDTAEMQRATRLVAGTSDLARRSGNERVIEAFAAGERDLDPTAGTLGAPPEEMRRRAERAVGLFLASYQTSRDECREAGVPIEG